MTSVKIIKVIQTEHTRGTGTEKDPFRIVIQYWSMTGILIKEVDPNDKDFE